MSISVIIPVYNSEPYLCECVDSVLAGLREEDEIILVENGSRDRSLEMCRNYASEHPNVTAEHLDKPGVSGARNRGIELASGEWIVFLDSDDVMDPGFLAAARKAPRDMDLVLYSYCYLGDPAENAEHDPQDVRRVSPKLLRRASLQFGKYQKKVRDKANLDNITIWSCCSRLIKRELILQNQIHFPEKLYLSEDTVFSLQVYCNAKKVCTVRQNSFFYRRTPGSASRKKPDQRALENNQHLREWVWRYVTDKGMGEELEKEVSAFLCRKFVEECLYLRELDLGRDYNISYVKEQVSRPYMEKALQMCGYRYLIAGKKNTLRYGPVLWLLKKKMYRTLFIGS